MKSMASQGQARLNGVKIDTANATQNRRRETKEAKEMRTSAKVQNNQAPRALCRCTTSFNQNGENAVLPTPQSYDERSRMRTTRKKKEEDAGRCQEEAD